MLTVSFSTPKDSSLVQLRIPVLAETTLLLALEVVGHGSCDWQRAFVSDRSARSCMAVVGPCVTRDCFMIDEIL